MNPAVYHDLGWFALTVIVGLSLWMVAATGIALAVEHLTPYPKGATDA